MQVNAETLFQSLRFVCMQREKAENRQPEGFYRV